MLDIQTEEAAQNLSAVRARIDAACLRARRDASDVLLIGAAKSVTADRLQAYLQAGLHDVGENYVQEGLSKVLSLGRERATWHLIGALQRNKAREAVAHFDWIHSLDRLPLARALNEAAAGIDKLQRVLVQVNLGNEFSKAGCAPTEIKELVQACVSMSNLQVCGLMALPPFDENPEKTRPHFRRLRELRDELRNELNGHQSTLEHLSMGMTHDLEIAIEEGATMIRVGTGLFGRRAPKA